MNFPPISDATIEAYANQLLADFHAWLRKQVSMPVQVEVIAEQYLGYDIDVTDEGLFCDPNYLGGIVFDDNVIKINAATEAHEGRYNFTLAHEIGHHVMHRTLFLEQQSEIQKILCRETGDKPLVEQQADRFAAALLMPESFVRAAFAQLDEGSLPKSAPNTQALRALAGSMLVIGGFSNVSNTAMINRLIDLRLVSGAKYQTGTPQDFLRKTPSLRWVIKNPLSRAAYKLLSWVRSLTR
jgi:Zn-dependent peptidase ImmA (M78 family)